MHFFRRIVIVIVIVIVILGALGGILGDRVFFPWLASFPQFSFLGQFAKNGGTTIINPTEQITITEAQGLERAVQRFLPAVVSVELVSAQVKTRTTGVILTEDGLIATDGALAAGRGTLFVTRHGERLPAELVRIDSASNVALIRISARNLPFPDFENSVSLGETLAAIRMGQDGSPEVFHAYVHRVNEDGFTLPFVLDNTHRGMAVVTLEGKLAGLVVSSAKAGDFEVVTPHILRALLLRNNN